VISFSGAPAAVQGRRAQPRAQLVELDFSAARAFGGDASITGIGGPTPRAGSAAISADLASRADVRVGDPIEVFAFGRQIGLVVDRILPRVGLAGFWPIDQRQRSYDVFVAPGTLASFGLAAATLPLGVEPPHTYVAISNDGGVEDAAGLTDRVVAAVQPLVGDGVLVQTVKHDLLTEAAATADSLSQLYFTMGMFTVAAGVLLLVNIFVMLADDRRSQLGMLRALGLKRRGLVAAFATEGWMYSIVASAIGALLGIQIGHVIAWRADQILGRGDELYSLHLTFSYRRSTVVEGFAFGLVVSMVTIVLTSVRVSRLNVIAAIRDLPAVRRHRLRTRWAMLGSIAVAAGAVWTATAAASGDGYGLGAGPMITIVGLAAVTARRFPPRHVVTVAALAVLAWGTAMVPALNWFEIQVDIPIFLVQGLGMAGAAVALLTVHQARIGGALSRVFGGALPVRIGLAYPIARRFRTAMTLGMFAVVVLTLTYLSVISLMFRNQVGEMTADLSGGFGVVVTSNPSDPVPAAALASFPGVTDVAPLAYGTAQFQTGDREPIAWPITGFGPELLAAPPVLADRGAYATDSAAWLAVMDDPSLVIVDEFFLSTGGPNDRALRPGDEVTVTDPVTAAARRLTVAAMATGDMLNNGAFYGIEGYRQVFGDDVVASRFDVHASDPDAAADAIGRAFVQHGADAVTVRDSVESLVAQNTGFFTLMKQFVGAGLLVGIAGIAVLMVRSIRERTRDVGVLRSLGFQPRAVAETFLLEASFIAVEGVLTGVIVALIGSYGLVLNGTGFMAGFEFAVPWAEVGVIVGIALVATGITAVLPSLRAARIKPAVALRVAD
jgi:putative ABC transport system permease protein